MLLRCWAFRSHSRQSHSPWNAQLPSRGHINKVELSHSKWHLDSLQPADTPLDQIHMYLSENSLAMATPEEQSVGNALISLDNPSVWQILIFNLWVLCSLLRRLAGSEKEFLKRCFLAVSRENRPQSWHEILEDESSADSLTTPLSIRAALLKLSVESSVDSLTNPLSIGAAPLKLSVESNVDSSTTPPSIDVAPLKLSVGRCCSCGTLIPTLHYEIVKDKL